MQHRWQQLTALVCIVLLSKFGVAQKLTSKQWLHNHCKAYQEDYAPLVSKLLSRYQGGIDVADVLNLKVPLGRSAPLMDGARPVVYLVNNTLHYAEQNGNQRRQGHVLCWLFCVLHASHKKVEYCTSVSFCVVSCAFLFAS